MMTLGDSKTNSVSNTWPSSVAFANGTSFYDLSPSLSTITSGDDRLTTVAPNMPAILAANGNRGNAYVYNKILMDLGTHDILANNTLDAAAHTAFVADYQTVLDALHTSQPGATVWCHRDWVQGRDARSDTIDGWIDEAVVSRPTFAMSGPDQRVWFKPNVAADSSDGTHFTTLQGQADCDAAWDTVLGFP